MENNGHCPAWAGEKHVNGGVGNMNVSGKDTMVEAREKVSELIYSWSRSGKGKLDVVTLPNNGSDIFIKTILGTAAEGQNVLYITDEKDNIKLVESIKRNYPETALSELAICSTGTAREIEETFDLVIYDEINSMPKYSDEEIIELVETRTRADGKCIIYSVKNKFSKREGILLPAGDRKVPMIEPREILTRIDMNKDIPFVVYDYIKWSIKSGRNVLIYLPDKVRAEKVYEYISRYCAGKCSSVSCFLSGESDIKIVENFFKKDRSVMVTNELEIPKGATPDTDIMVFFAGDKRFSAKVLTHLASRVVKMERHDLGEVVFLCSERKGSVEEAKDIIRRFNREAWELGLLKA
jgi:late competence protein required for DNA uptake (superfamily II DNA/RNA helicase)